MPCSQKYTPGNPCCDTTCEIDTTISNFKVVSGAATQGGGVATIDPGSVLVTRRTAGRVHMAVEAEFAIGTAGAYVEFRICWNRTTGEYLFGRVYAAAAGLDAGKLEIGKFDGYSETILQGPFYLYTLDPEEVHSAVLCYDGQVLSLEVTTAESTDPYDYEIIPSHTDRVAAKADDDFPVPDDGFFAGVATDATSTTYELSSWTFLRRAGDPENEDAIACPFCGQCYAKDWSWSLPFSDEWEVISGTQEYSASTQSLQFEEAGEVWRRQVFRPSGFVHGHTWTFTLRQHLGFGIENVVECRFWIVDANNYWYVRFQNGDKCAIYQVSAGVPTLKEQCLFRPVTTATGRSFTCTIGLCTSSVSVTVRHNGLGAFPCGDGTFSTSCTTLMALEDIPDVPASYRVGFFASDVTETFPVNLDAWGFECGDGACIGCDLCEEKLGAETYQIELSGAPCPFEDMDGTYLTNTSHVPAEGERNICRWYIETYNGATLVSGAELILYGDLFTHPVTGESGYRIEVSVTQTITDPTLLAGVDTVEERETAITDCCDGYGDCEGEPRIVRFRFFRFIAADADQYSTSGDWPIECQSLDWTIGPDEVFAELQVWRNNGVSNQLFTANPLGTSYPGVDFSVVSVRVRSLPLP